MNIGVLKHEIRKHIIPIDDVEALKVHLKALTTNVHSWSLLSTCIEHDAIKCFKLLNPDFKHAKLNLLVTNHPANICMHLKEDQKLFYNLNYYQSDKLPDYFIAAYPLHVKKDHIYHSIHFFSKKNYRVCEFIVDTYVEYIQDIYITMLISHCKDDEMLRQLNIYCRRFNNVWNALSSNQKNIVDKPRLIKEDQQRLHDAVIAGNLKNIPIYFLYDILLLTYPDNYWLQEPMPAIQRLERLQKSIRKTEKS